MLEGLYRLYRTRRGYGEPTWTKAAWAYHDAKQAWTKETLLALADEGPPVLKRTWRGDIEPIETDDGLVVTVDIRADEYTDLDYLGDFKDAHNWSPRCVSLPRDHSARHEGWEYFAPATAYAEHREDYRRMGLDRHRADCLARSHVRADLERLTRYGDDWCLTSVEVTVTKDGDEVGSASYGGIESDCGDDYLDEQVRELTREALDMAWAELGDDGPTVVA
jgi:hypothetical protein